MPFKSMWNIIHRRNPVLVALLLITALTVAVATASGEKPTELIGEALDRSGMSRQIDRLPETILAALPANAFPRDASRREVQRRVRKISDTDRLKRLVADALLRDFRRDDLIATLKFYRTPAGRKLRRAASRALSPQVLKRVREERDIVTSLTEKRRALLERIVRAEEVAAANERLTQAVVRGLARGYGKTAADRDGKSPISADELSPPELRSVVDSAALDEIALTSYAYMLRNLSSEQLERIARFHESPAGKWFRSTTVDGLNEAAFRAAEAVGRSLGPAESTKDLPNHED